MKRFACHRASIQLTILLGVGLLAFTRPESSQALAMPAPMTTETLSTSPLVQINHGWSGGDVYDVTLHLQAGCATRPVRLLFPTVNITEDNSTSKPAAAGSEVTTASMWVTYDGEKRRYPVFLLKRETENTSATVQNTVGAVNLPQWTDYLDIRPGKMVQFRVRFQLPPMKLDNRQRPKHVPKTFTLVLNRLDIGCSTPLSIKQTFRLWNRDSLLLLGPNAS